MLSKKKILCAVLGALALSATAQTLPQSGEHNPIVSHLYTADPSVRVMNGRVYLLTDRDMEGQTSYSSIKELHLFSSADMVNWQHHGVVWDPSKTTKWAGLAWAPDIIARNGKYYIYYANGGAGIGVAVATKPEGPYTDPLGRALITKNGTPNANVEWLFDPSVFIDDNGQAYLYFGGGGPGNARVIKLNADMISTSGSAITIDVPYFFEALYMHKKNGTYYLSYSTNPANGMRIDYMTSKSPVSGFTHRGAVMNQPWENSNNNNHASITEYNGQSYVFYHNRALSNDRAGGNVYQRSVNVDRMFYNSDGTIRRVVTSATGVPALKPISAYATIEAEVIHKEEGVKTELASEGTLAVVMKAGSWVKVANVDFGSGGANAFTARYAANGSANVQIILDKLSNTPVGTLAVTSTGGTQNWQSKTASIGKVTGVHDVYLRATGNVSLNKYQFTAASGTSSSNSSSSSSKASSASSASSSAGAAPVLSGSSDYPAGFSKCANLGGSCSVSSGSGWVAFGRKGKWVTKYVGVGKSIACSVAAFGRDPGGNPNKCSFQK